MAHLTLALIGATGAIGKEILDLVEDDDRVGALVPIASRATKQTHVTFRGESLSVRELTPSAFESADVAIAACPASVGREGYQPLLEEGIPVIDLAGVYGTEMPIVAAGFQGGHGNRLREAGVVTAARPEAIVVSRILRILKEVSPVLRVSGTLMMPAALAGRDGVEELSRQVVSMFNSQEAPRKHFASGLAFDVIPSWGGLTERGWAGCELLNAIQVGLLTGVHPQAVALEVAVLPLFAGMAASIQVDLNPGWEMEAVLSALSDSDEVELTDPSRLMPRRMVGTSELAVGRVRANLTGTGLHLWVCCDSQRVAAQNAVDLLDELIWSDA